MTVTATKTPALRFSEFEGEWELFLGQEITEKITKGSSPNWQGFNYVDSGVLFVTSENVREGFLDLEKPKFLPHEFNKKQKNSTLKKGDILINIVGASIGRNAIYDSEVLANVNQAVAVFRISSLYNRDFISLYIQLEKTQKNFFSTQSESARPNLSLTDLRNLQFFLPTLPEQQKIATFLTTIDTRIQQLSRKKALLEQYKKGVMQQIFSQEIRFKDEEGKEFPAWEEKRLGAVFTFCQTNSFSRSLLNYERGAVKNIHYGDIHTKFPTIFDLSKEEVPFINESVDLSKIADENYCKVGDLIIADASEDYKDVGKAIEVVNLAGQTLLAGLHTLIVRDVKNQTVTGFKGYMMQTYNVRQQIMRLATGISVLGISKGNLSKVKLILPSPPEQQKITDFFFALDRQINLVAQQLERTQTFKKGLLQQMFV